MSYQSPPTEFVRYWYWEIWDFIPRVRAAYNWCPFYVSSWWRDEATNRAVGGDPFSQHLIGLAIDAIPVPPRTTEQLAAAFRASGLIAVVYARHVHAQLYPAGFLERWLSS